MVEESTCRTYMSLLKRRGNNSSKALQCIGMVLVSLIGLHVLIRETPDAKIVEPLNEQKINSILKATATLVEFALSADYATARKIVRETLSKSHEAPEYEHTERASVEAENDNDRETKYEHMGIALVDLNNDGRREIIYYEPSPTLCGNKFPCPFGVLIHDGEKGWRLVLDAAIWGGVNILSTKNHGYNDIRVDLADENKTFEIWRFDGEKYTLLLGGSTISEGGIEIVSVGIYEPRGGRWRFVDKR